MCINVCIACSLFPLDLLPSRLTDLLVGAPMFMVRDSDGRLEELGRVYVYLQMGPLELAPHLPHLTGTQIFSRFGSSITPLGDLNQDGFNGESHILELHIVLCFCLPLFCYSYKYVYKYGFSFYISAFFLQYVLYL